MSTGLEIKLLGAEKELISKFRAQHAPSSLSIYRTIDCSINLFVFYKESTASQ